MMRTSEIILDQSVLEKFPAEKLAFLFESVPQGKNIHVWGETGWGRGTLVRLLTSQLPWDESIIIVDESYRDYVSYDDSNQTITEYHPSVILTDPSWAVLRPRPSAVVINGDSVLKPRGRAYDLYSGIPYTEEQIEYFHDTMIWGMASTGVKVISAGTRSISEIENHVKEQRPNSRIPCHIEVAVKPASGEKDDGTTDYELDISVLI